jgi:hypothetical protein
MVDKYGGRYSSSRICAVVEDADGAFVHRRRGARAVRFRPR